MTTKAVDDSAIGEVLKKLLDRLTAAEARAEKAEDLLRVAKKAHNRLEILAVGPMARCLRVPVKWLRSEAEAGRLPHVKAGRAILFNPETVERVLVERATSIGGDSQ